MTLRTFFGLAVFDVALTAVAFVMMFIGLSATNDALLIRGFVLAHVCIIMTLTLLHLSLKGPRATVPRQGRKH